MFFLFIYLTKYWPKEIEYLCNLWFYHQINATCQLKRVLLSKLSWAKKPLQMLALHQSKFMHVDIILTIISSNCSHSWEPSMRSMSKCTMFENTHQNSKYLTSCWVWLMQCTNNKFVHLGETGMFTKSGACTCNYTPGSRLNDIWWHYRVAGSTPGATPRSLNSSHQRWCVYPISWSFHLWEPPWIWPKTWRKKQNKQKKDPNLSNRVLCTADAQALNIFAR